jgi:hypothetical protein
MQCTISAPKIPEAMIEVILFEGLLLSSSPVLTTGLGREGRPATHFFAVPKEPSGSAWTTDYSNATLHASGPARACAIRSVTVEIRWQRRGTDLLSQHAVLDKYPPIEDAAWSLVFSAASAREQNSKDFGSHFGVKKPGIRWNYFLARRLLL